MLFTPLSPSFWITSNQSFLSFRGLNIYATRNKPTPTSFRLSTISPTNYTLDLNHIPSSSDVRSTTEWLSAGQACTCFGVHLWFPREPRPGPPATFQGTQETFHYCHCSWFCTSLSNQHIKGAFAFFILKFLKR